MLLLSRRLGETIMIGDNIEITVLGISGNQVRLGFEAPVENPIHRKEVFDKIKAEEAKNA